MAIGSISKKLQKEITRRNSQQRTQATNKFIRGTTSRIVNTLKITTENNTMKYISDKIAEYALAGMNTNYL